MAEIRRILGGPHDGGREEGQVDPPVPVGQTELHNILANERRRVTIREIVESEDEELTVRELSERIAAHEAGTDPAPREIRHSVYVTLQQNHVPKLADHDVVAVDGTSNCIGPTERTPTFYQRIDETPSETQVESTSERNVVLALLLGTALGLVGILDVLPVGLFPEYQIAVVFVLWQLGLVVIHTRYCS